MKSLSDIQEIRIHYVRPHVGSMRQIKYLQEAVELFRIFIDPNRIDLKEFFWVMLLSHSHHVLGISEIAIGDTNEVAIPTKELFQLALMSHANCLILCHNHPSGELQPSQNDISLTKDIIAFANLVNIRILDHVILTSEGHCSFVNDGLL